MKTLSPLFTALLAAQIGCGPKMPASQVAAIRPEKPQAGAALVLYYNPASPEAALPHAAAPRAEVLVLRNQEPPLLLEQPMQKKGALWRGRLILSGEAQMLVIRYADGGQRDDNRGEYWQALVYSGDGRPVRGAHIQKSRLLRGRQENDFSLRVNLQAAETELEAELAIYPQSLEAKTALWDLLLQRYPGESARERVRNEVRQVYEGAAGDEETLAALLPFFFRTGQDYAARQIIEESVSLLPRGRVAEAARRLEIEQESDPAKKASMIEAFERDFQHQAQSLK